MRIFFTSFLVLVFNTALLAQNFTDSNLPIVIITTDIDPNTGQPMEIPDDPKILGSMKIIYHTDGSRNYLADQNNPAFLNYNGRMAIEIRGTTSQFLPKKPYSFTTLQNNNTSNNNVSLLNMPAENDWILNSLAFDQTLMRDHLTYNLARGMGDYATRGRYCEVIINGDYKGLYILMEKIKINSERVNIIKMTTADNNLPNVTGGYITKCDKTTGGDPIAWSFQTNILTTVDFIHESPKPVDITAQQNNYIYNEFSSLETIMQNQNASIVDGFPSRIDVPSFVDFILLNEFASNVDAYQYSTFFHKDRNGKLRAGPVWDFNLSYGLDVFGDRSKTDVWQFDNGDNVGASFWKNLFDNPVFRCYLNKRWNEMSATGMPLNDAYVETQIDTIANLLAEARIRENARWGTITDYNASILEMKSWIQARIAWVNSHILPSGNCVFPVTPPVVISKIHYNPLASGGFSSNNLEFIELTNNSDSAINMSGYYFRELGITYSFPVNTILAPRKRLYLSSNATVFSQYYGFAAFGVFTRNLSNKSQKLVLADPYGNVVDRVEYDDSYPWPTVADGTGPYLVLGNLNDDNALASSWSTSSLPLCNGPKTSLTVIAACDSFLWNQNTYYASGSYSFTTVNAVGCDSIATVQLTINHASADTSFVKICSGELPYTWNGNIYSDTGTYSLHFTNIHGCDSLLTLVLSLYDTIVAGAIDGPGNSCLYTGIAGDTATYTINATGASNYWWTLPSAIAYMSGQGTNTIRVKYANSFSSGAVTVQVQDLCGNSLLRILNISRTIPLTPEAIIGPQTACAYISNNTEVTYSILPVMNATTYRWTLPSNASLVSATADSLSVTIRFNTGFADGTVSQRTIKVRSVSPCGNSADRSLIIAASAPATPGVITGNTDACPYIGTANEMIFTIRKVSTATSYQWTLPAGVTFGPGDIDHADTLALLRFDSSFLNSAISVKAVSDCGQSGSRSLMIYKKTPVTPGAISGPTDPCPFIGLDTVIYYTIRPVLYATSYAWTTPSGCIIVDHPAGIGLRDTIIGVKWLSSFNTGAITVVANSNCQSSGTRSLTVTRKVPSTPSVISGPADICPLIGQMDSVNIYKIRRVANATSYNWLVPQGAIITSHNGGIGTANDTIITVYFDSSFTGGNISVSASNNCFTSGARSLSLIRRMVVAPGVIVAGIPASCPNREVVYSVLPVPNATFYQWILPAGTIILSGEYTNNIRVLLPNNFISDSVGVRAGNNCSISAWRKLKVTYPACTSGGTQLAAPLISVNDDSKDLMEIIVSPNPSGNDFAIELRSRNHRKNCTLQVSDINGRIIETRDILNETGIVHIGMNYKKGVYFAVFREGDIYKTVKLIKM